MPHKDPAAAKEYQRSYTRSEKYKAKDRERYRTKKKVRMQERFREKHYGVTPAAYAALIKIQGNACAICYRDFSLMPPKHIHIDHDHKTKTVRGLLCSYCNLAEGYIGRTGVNPTDFGKRLTSYHYQPPATLLDFYL